MGATQAYVYDDSCVADAAIARYRIVVAGNTKDHVKYPAGQDAAEIYGVSQHATTASGDTILVRRLGITKVEVASGSVTRGVPLRAFDVVGRADYQSGLWASGDGVLGYSEETSSASGDIIESWIAIRQLLG